MLRLGDEGLPCGWPGRTRHAVWKDETVHSPRRCRDPTGHAMFSLFLGKVASLFIETETSPNRGYWSQTHKTCLSTCWKAIWSSWPWSFFFTFSLIQNTLQYYRISPLSFVSLSTYVKSHWEELASWEFWWPEKRLLSQFLCCSVVTNQVSLWCAIWWERVPESGTTDHVPPWQEPYISDEFFKAIKPDNIARTKPVDGTLSQVNEKVKRPWYYSFSLLLPGL